MILRNPEGISLTPRAIEKKATKLQRLYMKRLKKHEGRRPEKELFILAAAYLLFKQKYPDRKIIFGSKLKSEWNLFDWLNNNFSQYCNEDGTSFDWKKLYKWKARRPFKEMQWEGAWEDLRVAQKISLKGVNKKEMSKREIMRMHSISKEELKDLTGFILSHNIGNEKTSDKFVFNRRDK